MIDLGDTVPGLTFYTYNDAGVLTDATTVVVTITLPDLTTVPPAVTHTGTGVYSVVGYVAVQSGRHLVGVAATGAVVGAFNDVFNVEPAAPYFLISLAEARTACNIPQTDTSKDDDLRTYVEAVNAIVERRAGPQIQETRTATYDGGVTYLLLPDKPTSIVSVVEAGATLVVNSDYVVNLLAGVVTRGSQRTPYLFLPGIQNIVVTYKTGQVVVHANVRLAARIILADLWQSETTGFRPQFGTPDNGVTNVPTSYIIPPRAEALLDPTPALPGFA